MTKDEIKMIFIIFLCITIIFSILIICETIKDKSKIEIEKLQLEIKKIEYQNKLDKI